MKSLSEFAKENGLSRERVRQLCVANRIVGAMKIGAQWVVSDDAVLAPRKPGRPKALAEGLAVLPKDARKKKDHQQQAFKQKKEFLRPFDGCKMSLIDPY